MDCFVILQAEMSEPTSEDMAGRGPELPKDWRLFLVNAKMKVVAVSGIDGFELGNSQSRDDLADYLTEESMDLAGVGELLVCLEEMPSECELRMRIGDPGLNVVARGVTGAKGVSCVVLRPRIDPEAEKALSKAWDWASWMARSLGLLDVRPEAAPIRALFVDQNSEVVDYGKTLARKLGCRSFGATSAGEALAQAKARLYDLVVIDALVPGLGASALGQLLRERSGRDWGRCPTIVIMSKDIRSQESVGQLAIEKPIGMSELKEMVAIARRDRHDFLLSRGEDGKLEVLRLDVWQNDKPLLRRLSQAFMAQATEFTSKLSENPSYSLGHDFGKDLKSLKNGCDLLHAYRLSEVCRELLAECQDPDSRVLRQKLDGLLVEIESFRLFAASHGLLRDSN
ncbi:response regulator receiver domain protein [Verrucomicrobiia bacterium DG1235]|nr:response regulator receiver domain protein [Verrucomicrobiae bacterium DG1235]